MRPPLTPRAFVVALTIATLAAACGPQRTTAPGGASTVFPAAEWDRHARPEAAGFCPAGLDTVTARARELSTTAIMAVVGGRVSTSTATLTTVSYLASVRKSMLSMLYGNYVESGSNPPEQDARRSEHRRQRRPPPLEKQATIADLLGARSGVYHAASNRGDNLADAPPRGSQKPGTYYLYSNWDFNALGTIFEQETGQNIYDALERDLARPIGMQDFDRATHRRNGDATTSHPPRLPHEPLDARHGAHRLPHAARRELERAAGVPRDWAQRDPSRRHAGRSEMNPRATARGRSATAISGGCGTARRRRDPSTAPTRAAARSGSTSPCFRSSISSSRTRPCPGEKSQRLRRAVPRLFSTACCSVPLPALSSDRVVCGQPCVCVVCG